MPRLYIAIPYTGKMLYFAVFGMKEWSERPECKLVEYKHADCASFKLCLDFLLCRELTGRGPRGAVMGRALILSRKKLGKPTNLDFISMFLLFSMSD